MAKLIIHEDSDNERLINQHDIDIVLRQHGFKKHSTEIMHTYYAHPSGREVSVNNYDGMWKHYHNENMAKPFGIDKGAWKLDDHLVAHAKQSKVKPKSTSCGCRSAQAHRDCAYCGVGWDSGKICGACKQNGVDGPVIRGTEARKCKNHK